MFLSALDCLLVSLQDYAKKSYSADFHKIRWNVVYGPRRKPSDFDVNLDIATLGLGRLRLWLDGSETDHAKYCAWVHLCYRAFA